MRRDYQNRLFANKANLFFPASSGKKRVLLYVKIFGARANFPVTCGYPKRDLLAPKRQERQVRKFSFFAPLREIFRVFGCGFAALVFCGSLSSRF
jgi:hypothetical protein